MPKEGAVQIEGQPNGEEPDYKALYEESKAQAEEAKAHSREWEKRAKDNKNAAKQLEEAQQAGKTAEERIADLTKRLDAKEKAEERAKVAAKVAEAKGVPADLLMGDDEEAMSAYADKLLKHFKKKPASSVEKPGSFPRGADGGSSKRDFINQLFGND